MSLATGCSAGVALADVIGDDAEADDVSSFVNFGFRLSFFPFLLAFWFCNDVNDCEQLADTDTDCNVC